MTIRPDGHFPLWLRRSAAFGVYDLVQPVWQHKKCTTTLLRGRTYVWLRRQDLNL